MLERNEPQPSPGDPLLQLIRSIRGQRVILDADLARIYGVETRALNQALKRNQERFPEDFAFELARDEILRISQTVISLRKLAIGFHVKEDAVPYHTGRKPNPARTR